MSKFFVQCWLMFGVGVGCFRLTKDVFNYLRRVDGKRIPISMEQHREITYFSRQLTIYDAKV